MADEINKPADGGANTNTDTKADAKTPQSFTEADVAARAEAAIKAQRERAESEKSEIDRYKGKLDELAPRAKRAEALETALKNYLASEEEAVPKEKRGLLKLAPSADNPEARLEWIQNAKKEGLFGVAADPKTPANTRAGGTPPAAGAQQGKHPRDMTDQEFLAFQQQRRAQQGQR